EDDGREERSCRGYVMACKSTSLIANATAEIFVVGRVALCFGALTQMDCHSLARATAPAD
ncbi:hypothetical protein, partial [Paraburkholderia sp. RL17-347-BIC-D]|uniref:hypothetical protein n=1 Tax=Paraburkholderia sp. RL17-347-BIC-D TaxID=3031632 RepID=UPI0038BACF30